MVGYVWNTMITLKNRINSIYMLENLRLKILKNGLTKKKKKNGRN